MVGLPLPEFLHGVNNGVQFAFLQFLLTLPVVYVNRKFFFNGFRSLFHKAPNMDTLVAVGSGAALIYGAAAGGMIVTVMYWFRSFTAVMTSDKLLYIFGSLSPKLALLLSMALRYVPLFGHQAHQVSRSQQALGLYKEDNLIDRMRGGMRVFYLLLFFLRHRC